ncbi:50S ribosomal protein L23 [Candidatus Woesearchaeota archaeon]|nr:50S ribosomal protein L23 [Candidatus Woesearchaeota archaeon]
MDPYKIIKNPVQTEKATMLMEAENKLVFVIDRKATKKDVKEAVEKLFNVKVMSVNLMLSSMGIKKAYVRLTPDFLAMDIATKLGMI